MPRSCSRPRRSATTKVPDIYHVRRENDLGRGLEAAAAASIAQAIEGSGPRPGGKPVFLSNRPPMTTHLYSAPKLAIAGSCADHRLRLPPSLIFRLGTLVGSGFPSLPPFMTMKRDRVAVGPDANSFFDEVMHSGFVADFVFYDLP